MRDPNLETIKRLEIMTDDIEEELKLLTLNVDWKIRRHVNYSRQKALQLKTSLWDVHRDLTGENRE